MQCLFVTTAFFRKHGDLQRYPLKWDEKKMSKFLSEINETTWFDIVIIYTYT